MAETKLSTNQLIIAVFICGLSLGILLALNAARPQIQEIPVLGQLLSIPSFESPMFFALPFFGFFAIFFLVDWINGQFKTKLASTPLFPIIFFLLSIAAYYVALYWYIAQFMALQGQAMTPDQVDLWGRLAGSAFMPFIWAGVFGWIARFAVEKVKL